MEESGKIKGIIIGGVVVLLALLTIGILINLSQKTAQAGPSIQEKQLQMMTEAMEMAREAQRAQRDHMRLMQQEMEAAEGGYAAYDDAEGYEGE
jgi:uncharacterized protein YneF (UPF0154 family)